jgi:hypothetical protein
LNLRDAGIEGLAAEELLAALPASCKALRFLDLSGEGRKLEPCIVIFALN